MKLYSPHPTSRVAPPVLLKTARRFVRAGLTFGIVGIAGLAHTQALYSITEQAGPSETLSVRGDALAANTMFKVYPYSPTGVRGSAVTCPIDSTNGVVSMFSLPSTIADTVYEVVAATSKGSSNGIFVNRPRMVWSDVPDAMPDNIVRIVGRNFRPNLGKTPTVTLTNTSTKIAYNPTLETATDTSVSFRVPANATAGSYKISINNNLAGSASMDPNALSLAVKAKANDPFALGVAWGADFNTIANNVYNAKTDPRLPWHVTGNGNDEGNQLASILWRVQQSGGGTVYVPSGTYRIDDGSAQIVVPPNVVLKGEGKGKTILQVCYYYTPTHAPDSQRYPMALWGEGGGLNGIADLTIENLNTSSVSSNVLRGGPVYQTTNKSFLKSVEIKLNNGTSITNSWPRKAMIADCDIVSTSLTSSPIYMPNVMEFQFLRNNVNYRSGRIVFPFSQRCVFEGNTIQYDNAYRTPSSVETGGIELGYGQQILLQGNNIGGYGPLPTKSPTGDGELAMTQYSNLDEFTYVGMVKSVVGKVLVPKETWGTTVWQNGYSGPVARKYIMIVNGKGAGQWRRVTAWSNTALMVDAAWQVNPDSTSRYEIMTFNNYQQTWTDNNFFGGSTAISIYDGAFDSVVARNTLTNTGAIVIRSSCNPAPSPSNYVVGPTWDVSVFGNSVTDSNGFMPGCIAVAAIDVTGLGFGQMTTSVDVRRNTIVGCYLPPRAYEITQTDGIEISTIFHTGSRPDSTVNVGTIVQSNSISGTNYPLQLRYAGFGEFSNVMISD